MCIRRILLGLAALAGTVSFAGLPHRAMAHGLFANSDPCRLAANPGRIHLCRPSFLALDASDNLYVTDGFYRIVKLSPTGRVIARWGSIGTRPGQFSKPSGIGVDGQ